VGLEISIHDIVEYQIQLMDLLNAAILFLDTFMSHNGEGFKPFLSFGRNSAVRYGARITLLSKMKSRQLLKLCWCAFKKKLCIVILEIELIVLYSGVALLAL